MFSPAMQVYFQWKFLLAIFINAWIGEKSSVFLEMTPLLHRSPEGW